MKTYLHNFLFLAAFSFLLYFLILLFFLYNIPFLFWSFVILLCLPCVTESISLLDYSVNAKQQQRICLGSFDYIFFFHIEEFMLPFKINAFLYLYIYILALIQFHSSQTTSFPLLPFSNLFFVVVVAEVVFVILPRHHSHFMWGRLSSLLKWRA